MCGGVFTKRLTCPKYPQGYAYVRFQILRVTALFLETSIQFTSLHPVGVGTGVLIGKLANLGVTQALFDS